MGLVITTIKQIRRFASPKMLPAWLSPTLSDHLIASQSSAVVMWAKTTGGRQRSCGRRWSPWRIVRLPTACPPPARRRDGYHF